MAEVLQGAGYSTVEIASPVEALRKVKFHKFDALVLDVYMPEMSGLLFHAKLKLLDPVLSERTLFVSGKVTRDELRRHFESQPNFLLKPFDIGEFTRRVAAILPPKPRAAA